MVLWYLLSIHSLSNPNADILVTSLVLKHCAHALRQPRGCHLLWNEALLALRSDDSPRPRSGSGESIGYCLRRFQSQHACAVAPGCWTHPCASRPRKSCSIGYCRKQAYLIGYCRMPRGPPVGRMEFLGPAGARPGTLRACTPAGRRHISFRVHARLTPAVPSSPDPASACTKAVAIVPKLEPLLLHVRAQTPCPVAKERTKLRRTPLLHLLSLAPMRDPVFVTFAAL